MARTSLELTLVSYRIVDSLLAQSIEWRSRSFETFLLGAVTVPLFDARVEEKRELKLSWAGVLFIFMLLDASHLLTAFTRYDGLPDGASPCRADPFSPSSRILSHEGPIENFAIPFSEIITATVMRLSTLCGIYSFSPVRLARAENARWGSLTTPCLHAGRPLPLHWRNNGYFCHKDQGAWCAPHQSQMRSTSRP